MILRGHHLFTRQETWLCLVANRWGHRGAVRAYFSAISRLGNGVFWYVLMGLIVLERGLFDARWSEGFLASAHMAGTGAVALVIYLWLKRHFQRTRPYNDDARISALVPVLDEFSFPSGHTLHAVSFTIVAVHHYPLLAILLVPFTLSVAASRVVLGVHYPSDVLAATFVGGLIGTLSVWVGPGTFWLG
jgi:undecaprenyl-diphosphatase